MEDLQSKFSSIGYIMHLYIFLKLDGNDQKYSLNNVQVFITTYREEKK